MVARCHWIFYFGEAYFDCLRSCTGIGLILMHDVYLVVVAMEHFRHPTEPKSWC